MRLELPAGDRALLELPRALPAVSDPTQPFPPPLSFSGAKASMALVGLNLAPGRGPGDFLVIDAIENRQQTKAVNSRIKFSKTF